ncbi:hypothetical protein BHE90_010074 [Fusarium euwallaceae]|uniref:Aminoglycoside phosphotransferase domain-containing protein n=1 Tax=Fusarium euwallaceae TaxID=1147111 RepID=A0A430LID7_9HYPO|nr:hypothetical protein BHE90_010074 [Fusarium euwallaceae]
MMDYVQGQALKNFNFKKGKRRRSNYPGPSETTSKLADVYTQLRQLEFPKVSALGLPIIDGKPSYDCDSDMHLAENEFDKLPDPGFELHGVRNALYVRHHFRRFVLDTWLDSSADKGPFILMHDDMLMLMSSLLFDDDLILVAILDWQWSFVVPAQMVVPPVWLRGSDASWILIGTNLFHKEVRGLVSAVRDREGRQLVMLLCRAASVL